MFDTEDTMLLFQQMTAADAMWSHQVLGWDIVVNGDDMTAEVYDRDGRFLGTTTLL